MIKLEVKGYCNNCTEFEPDVNKDTITTVSPNTFFCDGTINRTIVRCKHRHRCESMVDFLHKEGKT